MYNQITSNASTISSQVFDPLQGTWVGEGRGQSPTVTSFDYRETLTFTRRDEKILAYEQRTQKCYDGQTRVVQGVLISTVNTTFRLEFFSNNVCDPSGYGEAQTYVGFATLETNITGHVNFRITLPTSIAAGKFVTATATDSANNTSELSRCIIVSR